MAKLFVEDVQWSGKKVAVRVDFNVPLNEAGEITNDKRIVAALPTINYLCQQGAKVVLMSHLGRPKGKRSAEFSLAPVAKDLKQKLDFPVLFVDDCIGESAEKAIADLENSQVLLLENLRFYSEETDNDEAFAKKLASQVDAYVNDAFGTAHRAHASTEGITRFLDTCASGYLMKKELDFLGGALSEPKRPFVALIGGAKISGKIDVIKSLLEKVDALCIGGGMAYTFYKAKGFEIGTSLLEEDKVGLAAELLQEAKDKGKNLMLPRDCVVAKEFSNDAVSEVVPVDGIPEGKMGLDIGPATVEAFSEVLSDAKTVVWNGPMGVFEFPNFAKGTLAVAEQLAQCTEKGAITVIGGGDSASAISKAGLADKMSHISTGGGASLEFLEGKVLPGVAALTDA